ncbi:MAG TPA: deoxyguanosinetriphosphate triphosphohydrolase [Aggregatilineales bacterium]|jgi:dGTPase|nr:deoxyguanosinetriphosphate triphosphohydrolase [Aggregatilineales bacterium]
MYRTREQLEQIELDTLAPYAEMSRYSRGRRHPDHEPDYRTAFQRDRDRVVHAAAFRRLEYKTQVFVNDLGDYYRTRLTHTLEVAQIGRTMARALAINEDLVEVICLAHDLGHPPFGHSGETALNALLADHGGFNHNHQSYRVVSELERRYPRWHGLNLTFETLEGIAKHETEYDLSLVAGFDYDKRGGLEAQVANIADELAYNAHDLDDGLQSGLITPRQLKDLEIWQLLCERLGWSDDELDEVTRHRFIREQIGLQVDDVLRTTHAALEALQPQGADDIKNLSANIVAHSEQFKAYNRALKAFLYENMYYHPSVVRMSKRAERFINDLFTSFVSEPRQLPREFQQQVEENGLHRVVGDFIASMTDRSAMQEYSRLFDPLTRP